MEKKADFGKSELQVKMKFGTYFQNKYQIFRKGISESIKREKNERISREKLFK